MLSAKPESWKVLAWNGVSLRVPSEWEVRSLATFYLQLDNGAGPVLEVKWQRLKGKFSPTTHVRKLARLAGADSSVKLQERPTPDTWRRVLSGFDSVAFVWHGSDTTGKGVILYCTSCRTATILHFYSKPGIDDDQIPVQVLRSFCDHSEDGFVDWALFGLRARIPQRFTLSAHRFHPGQYQLNFQCRHERLHLSRWGPANVLLRTKELQDWFTQIDRQGPRPRSLNFRELDYDGKPAIQAESHGSHSQAVKLLARMTGKLPHIWMRVWHLPAQNQILGVEARGLHPPDQTFLEEVCRNYEVSDGEETSDN